MNRSIQLIVVEGHLEVPASIKLLGLFQKAEDLPKPVEPQGRIHFWKNINRYNQAARNLGGPVFGLADLESEPCPSGLIQKHLKTQLHGSFVLRIAERMLESWLLADPHLAAFLKISINALPTRPDEERHPKQTLVNLARMSGSRGIRDDLVPEQGSKGIVGKGYTPRMTEFIEDHWSPKRAGSRSESLRRAIRALQQKLAP